MRLFSRDWIKEKLKNTFFFVEKRLRFFATFHLRPKRAEQVVGLAKENGWGVAIVIQGQVVTDEDFTLETVKLYHKLFPEAKTIVSTWADTPKNVVQALENAGANVVLNTKPEVAGQQHINYQIVSSSEGMKEARSLGCQYALKTRTDHRLYASNALTFLQSIIRAFPLQKSAVQKERLIGASLNTFQARLYGISDMFLFGHIDDMEHYWNPPLDTRTAKVSGYNGFADLPKSLCEVYLMVEFLKKVGQPIAWSAEDFKKVLAERFCIVDEHSLDMYWYKYARLKEYRYRSYQGQSETTEVTFADWLSWFTAK